MLDCLIEGSLGYILNFGNMSYWGYMVLSGLFTIMGIFEWLIIELLWCSCYVVVFRIFLLHFVIGWLLGIFILFHILVLHHVLFNFILSSSNLRSALNRKLRIASACLSLIWISFWRIIFGSSSFLMIAITLSRFK